ncbi:LOW QUALITY PROTEIN: hypothetical protein ACHAW6_012250 [Cyclotella cf. meneghiniana]
MMRPCTQNPNRSAHEASFDATPLAPIGTECMLHVKPNRRHTWGYHSIKAWYFALALNHYRCIKVVTDTGVVHLAYTFTFLHHSLPTPTISNADCIIKAIQHLTKTIMNHPPSQPDKLEAITNCRNLISGTKPPAPAPAFATHNNAVQTDDATTSTNVQTMAAPICTPATVLQPEPANFCPNIIPCLDADGYYQCQFTLGLWHHKWQPITFSLVVDDFGVKRVGLTHAKHLNTTLHKYYKWTGLANFSAVFLYYGTIPTAQ